MLETVPGNAGEASEALVALLTGASTAAALRSQSAQWAREAQSLLEAVRVFWAAPPLQRHLRRSLDVSAPRLSEPMQALLAAALEDVLAGPLSALLPLVCPELASLERVLGEPRVVLALFEEGSVASVPAVVESEWTAAVAAAGEAGVAVRGELQAALTSARRLVVASFLGNVAVIYAGSLDELLADEAPPQ